MFPIFSWLQEKSVLVTSYWKNTIFLLLFLSMIIPVFSEDWIDPYDMGMKPIRNLKKNPIPDTKGYLDKRDGFNSELQKGIAEDTSIVYLKRFVSIILNFPIVNDGGQTVRSGKYELDTESENYRFLLEFTKKKNLEIQDLRKLDSILNEVFARNISNDFLNLVLSSRNALSGFLSSIDSLLVVCVCFSLFILYNLLKCDFSFWYIFRYFITILLIIDYGSRYKMLYEEVEKHNMDIQYSSKCDTKKMEWKQYFLFIFDQSNCDRRYVTPLEVFLSQVKHIIISPMSALGTGMGNFGKELWKNLPYPWNLIIFPLMLLFFVIMVAVLITTLNGLPFKMNLLRLVSLEFGKQSDDTNRITGSAVNRLLNILDTNHRPMVQDLPSTIRHKNFSHEIQHNISHEKEQPEKCEDEVGSSEKKKTPSKLGEKTSSGTPSSVETNHLEMESDTADS